MAIVTRKLSCAVFGATAVALVSGAPEADRISHLPGYPGELKSATYAGYIPTGEGPAGSGVGKMFEHYLFFESEGNPATDPLIVWTNGGPGAASFFGSFVELGPYYLDSSSLQTEAFKTTGVPSLFLNEYRWTKLGSLLIINSPPPVGFSYCEPIGPSGHGTACGSWNDTKTAEHNHLFLKNWFEAFPEYKKRDTFITGESYGGVYVPTMVREILNDPTKSDWIELKGFAVGDGCVSGSCVPSGPFFHLEFFHGHGQMTDKTFQDIHSTCDADALLHGGPKLQEPKCADLIKLFTAEVGPYFAYNLYDECYDFALQGEEHLNSLVAWWSQSGTRTKAPRTPMRPVAAPTTGGYQPHHQDGSPCGGTGALAVWVNASQVKAALHVAPDAYFFDGDNGAGFEYNETEPSLVPFYQHVTQNTSLRVLIYNGDADPSLNSFWGQNWTISVGLKETEHWRAWSTDGIKRVGGYVTRYEHNFDYLTIRGSGHMVPEYRPRAAFAFLSSWLKNEDYPRFQKTASTSNPRSSAHSSSSKQVEMSQVLV